MIVGDCETLGDEPRCWLHRLRQPEVQHLHGAVLADFDVGRLQIAMDDPLLVRRFEGFGDLLRDRQRLVKRDRSARDALREILALDQLHHEGLHAVGVLQPVDRGDVRMIQRGEDFRFALKARQAVGVGCQRRWEDLDGDLTLQLRVRRPIDFPHPTHAELRGDFVDAEAGAGREGQAIRGLYGRDGRADRITECPPNAGVLESRVHS